MNNKSILIRCFQIIQSCQTLDQLNTAQKYCNLALNGDDWYETELYIQKRRKEFWCE